MIFENDSFSSSFKMSNGFETEEILPSHVNERGPDNSFEENYYWYERGALSPFRGLLMKARTQYGTSLMEISSDLPVLVVFLRHFGCAFCRETLGDLASKRTDIEMEGAGLVIVHMSEDDVACSMMKRYGLGDVPRIEDRDQELYRAFQLERADFGQIFAPRIWPRFFQAGVLGRHGMASPARSREDGFQMPGVFLLHVGGILQTFRHKIISDRPDYVSLATFPADFFLA